VLQCSQCISVNCSVLHLVAVCCSTWAPSIMSSLADRSHHDPEPSSTRDPTIKADRKSPTPRAPSITPSSSTPSSAFHASSFYSSPSHTCFPCILSFQVLDWQRKGKTLCMCLHYVRRSTIAIIIKKTMLMVLATNKNTHAHAHAHAQARTSTHKNAQARTQAQETKK